MKTEITKEECERIKKVLIESLSEIEELKPDINDLPDFAKPYANINPYSEDADKKILEIFGIMHPEAIQRHPVWIQHLINQGLVDIDGKTVLASNLRSVAAAIKENEKIVVQKYHLQNFISAKTGKKYSRSQVLKTLEDISQ